MNVREKIVILVSLSLGVIAGACGIKRTLEVPALSSANYLKDTVGLIVWSAAEIAVTMICSGIPVCRPLYKRYIEKWTSRNRSNKYVEHSDGRPYHLKTFGGSTMPGQGTGGTDPSKDDSSEGGDSITRAERKLGIGGPFNKSYAKGGPGRVRGDDQSEESILGPDFRRSQRRQRDLKGQDKGLSINVTQEYRVTTSQIGR